MARLISRTKVKPPTLTGSVISASQINLVATAPAGFAVANYTFERSTDTFSWALLATQAGATYSATGLAEYSLYYFRARVTDSQGNAGSNSASYSARTLANAPTAPNLAAVRVNGTRADLAITPSSSLAGIASYTITRATNVAGPFTLVVTQAGLTYSDTTLTSGTTYYYRAFSTDSQTPALVSANSGVVTVLSTNAPPSWSANPVPSAVIGVPSVYSLPVSDPDGDTITITSVGVALPAGWSISGVTLVYDGGGVAATTPATLRLSATSTGGTADSALFSITIASANAAEADWIARKAGSVWAHDFRYANELTNFLWNNTDPRDSGVMPRIVADGPTGYCLEYMALGAEVASTFGTGATTLTINDATHWPSGDFYFHIAAPPGGYPAKRNNLFYCPAGGRSGTTLTGVVYQTSVAGFVPFSTVRESWPVGSIVGHHVQQTWNRPFSAFSSPGNGLPTDDIATGVTRRTWSPIETTPVNQYWGYGYYGRPEYQAAYPSWTPTTNGGPQGSTRVAPWDGDEFYLQFRIKIDPRFWDFHIPAVDTDTTWSHKLLFLQTQQTVPHQLVPYLSPNNRYNIPSTRTAPFQWYTTQAGRQLTENTSGTGSYQPGSQWAATAQYAVGNQAAGSAWEWYDNEWLTVLVRVKPGLDWNRTSNPSAAGVRNTLLEVKIARGGSGYTTIYSQADQAITFGSTNDSQNVFTDALPGYSAFIPTGYLNVDLGATPPKRSYYHRFTQIIFSKSPIPAPSEAPAWFTSQTAGTWGTVASVGTLDAVKPSPEPQALFPTGNTGQHSSLVQAWSGASIDPTRGEYLMVANGGHADYAGNESYALNLKAATPAWRRLTDPTPNAQMQFNPTEADGSFLDGRPKAMHNCFQRFANGKVWIGVQNSVTSGSGGDFNRALSFNRDDTALVAADGARSTGGSGASLAWTASNIGPWESLGAVPSFSSAVGSFGKQVYNPRDGFMYCLGGKGGGGSIYYWRINTVTGAVSAFQSQTLAASLGRFNSWAVCLPNVGTAGAIIAHDTISGLVGVMDCSKFGQSDAWVQKTGFSGTPYPAPDQFGGGDGVYLSAFAQVAVGNPVQIGGRIYKLQLPAGVTTVAALLSPTWTWSNFLPSGTAASGGGAGSWGKWELMEDMGNGQSAIVYCGSTTGPTHIYKVPTTGLP